MTRKKSPAGAALRGGGKTAADVEKDGSSTASVNSPPDTPSWRRDEAEGDGRGGDDRVTCPDGAEAAFGAVAAANILAVGEAPAMALSMTYQAMAAAAGQRMENAVLQQAAANTLLQTVTLKGVEQLLEAGRETARQAATLLTEANARRNGPDGV